MSEKRAKTAAVHMITLDYWALVFESGKTVATRLNATLYQCSWIGTRDEHA